MDAQTRKQDLIKRSQVRRSKFAEERLRADLMNLSLLIRQYPDKAKEFMEKFRLTVPQDMV